MRTLTRRNLAVGLAFTFLAAVIVTWFESCHQGSRREGGAGLGGLVGPSASPSFTISGDVTGHITPGASVPLDVSLDNPNDLALRVGRLTVTVTGVDAPQADAAHPCTAVDFTVRQLSGASVLIVERDEVEKLSELGVPRAHWPAVGLRKRAVNQDGCKAAVLTLGYEADGTEVRR